jgi:hypothetical protein
MANFRKLRQMIEVQGNGNITSSEKQVSSFLRIHLSINGNVELIQSTEEKVVIECDENLHDFFDITNSGRTLYVTSEAKLRRPVFTSLKVKVYIRQVDTIYNACHGNVLSDGALTCTNGLELKILSHGDTLLNINAPDLKLKSACHGNVTLTGNCGKLKIKAESHGDLDCRELRAGEVDVTNASHGELVVYSYATIIIKNAGHGNIYYYGPGQLKDIIQRGQGEIRHKE